MIVNPIKSVLDEMKAIDTKGIWERDDEFARQVNKARALRRRVTQEELRLSGQDVKREDLVAAYPRADDQFTLLRTRTCLPEDSEDPRPGQRYAYCTNMKRVLRHFDHVCVCGVQKRVKNKKGVELAAGPLHKLDCPFWAFAPFASGGAPPVSSESSYYT